MKRTLLISITLLIFLGRSLAQESDEFEIQESDTQMNQSSDEFNGGDELSSEPVPDVSPFGETSSSQEELRSEPVEEASQTNETTFDLSKENEVLVREEVKEEVQNKNPNGTDLVEVRYPQDVFLPYKQRQKDWGWIFSLGAETTNFPDLISQLDNTTFNELFGKSVTTASLEIGPKYNTPAGSFALLFGYGNIDVKDDRIGTEARLQLTRYSATAAYYLDTLFSEPYFVPYVAGGVWQADYRETSDDYPGETGKYTTDTGMLWRFGALLNLDWIEADRSRENRRRTGIQGTFINLYASSTLMSESDPDPNLETEMDIGASLVIEF